jgi:predicted nucleic acid-binding protein
VDHFRQGDASLRALLRRAEGECHPFVIGELACGPLRRRFEVLSLLERLPLVPVAAHVEVTTFVERHRLMGCGIGWIDAHLLASASLGRVLFSTRDRCLAKVAQMLRLYSEP